MVQFLDPETDVMVQFLAPEIVIMGERNYIEISSEAFMAHWKQKMGLQN